MVFGTVEKRFSWAAGDWTKITNDSIYHIEEDEKDPGKLLFCTESLIGSISQHFRIETVSTETYKIVGFAQHRDRRILIVDRDNGCVRSLSREAKAKQDWFGGCKNPGSYVRQNSVLLVRPFYIIVNLDIGFISDQNTVVVVDMENETVLKTILNTEESQVKIMAFSFDNDVVFLSGKLYLKRYNISETTTTIIHSDDPSSKSPGDGNFEMAKFKSIKSITSISTNILVISDRADSRLRILNLKTNSTSSICNSKVKDKNGDIKNCQLNKPSVLYYQRSIATLWIVTKNNLMSISIAPNKQGMLFSCIIFVGVKLHDGVKGSE